jgi:hypothetical protein
MKKINYDVNTNLVNYKNNYNRILGICGDLTVAIKKI